MSVVIVNVSLFIDCKKRAVGWMPYRIQRFIDCKKSAIGWMPFRIQRFVTTFMILSSSLLFKYSIIYYIIY